MFFCFIVGVFFARTAIVFPAIAINKPIGFFSAWKKTEDKLWWDLLNSVLVTLLVIFEVAMASHCFDRLVTAQQSLKENINDT